MTTSFERDVAEETQFVYSPQSEDLVFQGRELRLRIYKIDPCQPWCLVVLNDDGEITAWSRQFSCDRRARKAFDRVLAESGFSSFWTNWMPHVRFH